MTLACGKYRFNKLDFGEVAGLPRLLDIGQCNDVYSAIRIATALADAFGTDVNGLPLSLIISWYEQKAVADLLALLSLGIHDIYLGPTLPAFLSPNVLQYLTDTFHLKSISNARDDHRTCFGTGSLISAALTGLLNYFLIIYYILLALQRLSLQVAMG